MASCFATVFACCLRGGRSGSPGQEGPDERTHLIPPTSDQLSFHEPYVVDQQQLNARLGPIVRAKEGKMVNVNTPLPFNLHNRPLHDPSSRSASAHLDPSAAQRRVSGSPPRDDSASSIPTSRSTSSLQPGDASYLPPEADPEYGHRTVLNVRLVRGPPGAGVWTRRGRSVTRGRYSRFSGDGSSARQSQQEQKVWDGNGVANGECVLPTAAEVEVDDHEQNKEGNGVAGEEGRTEEVEEAESTPHLPAGGLPAGGGADAEGGAKAAAPDFHIEITDVGKISQSWGD
ncbi:hypothetical protein DAEQUDRAFT_763511 [Daedalea quercina L-15889]|uniref:Uncharacterized protein n=1 Tax=Daedalea quercina L-15889 TaxID=1314783 RepID=A0A165S7Z5_9APHY|nr:hypothetical protein DAEQUDRAFT_763511 [Daedalea quercina L-15889]